MSLTGSTSLTTHSMASTLPSITKVANPKTHRLNYKLVRCLCTASEWEYELLVWSRTGLVVHQLFEFSILDPVQNVVCPCLCFFLWSIDGTQ